MTHPYGMRAPPPPCWCSQGSSHLLQSERVLQALLPIPFLPTARAMILPGWRSSVLPQGFGNLQNSPRPDVSDPSKDIANLMETPHLPIFPFPQTPEVSPGVCKTLWKFGYKETWKGLLQFLDHFCLGLITKQPHFLLASWGVGGRFFVHTYVQWDTGHPKLFLMFLE